MLVTAKEMLEKARDGKYAVGHFNINNLEWTKAILLTAEEQRSPVILGVSEGAGKYMAGFKTIVGMVNGMLEELKITVPVALHLDHGTYEGAARSSRTSRRENWTPARSSRTPSPSQTWKTPSLFLSKGGQMY